MLHLKRTIMEQIFYAEFDGRRKKRVVIKVMGIQGSEDLRI